MYAIINAKMTYLDYAATSPLLPEVREAMHRAEEQFLRGFGVDGVRFDGIDESKRHCRYVASVFLVEYFFFHFFSDYTVST